MYRLFLLLLLLFMACRRERHLTPAFYHWQTTLDLSAPETAYLDSLSCQLLYIKVLDIARDPGGDIRPYALLELKDSTGLAGKTLIPVVFMTNGVFEGISPEKMDWLVQKTAVALRSACAQFPAGAIMPFGTAGRREIQFDCDWTASTRAAFFRFLEKMRAQLPAETRLSATIRLHQYKFPQKTGVPPVDRGMLMFYNTGDIENPETGNSIFLPRDAEKYVLGAPRHYPLPLDLALPVFSWHLVFRGGALWKIIPGELSLSDNACLKPLPTAPEQQATLYQLECGTFLGGHYLRPGDLLRRETISPQNLAAAASLAARTDLAPDATVAFFHLDSGMVRQFPPVLLLEAMKKIRGLAP